jgi:hypothetical protein
MGTYVHLRQREENIEVYEVIIILCIIGLKVDNEASEPGERSTLSGSALKAQA